MVYSKREENLTVWVKGPRVVMVYGTPEVSFFSVMVMESC